MIAKVIFMAVVFSFAIPKIRSEWITSLKKWWDALNDVDYSWRPAMTLVLVLASYYLNNLLFIASAMDGGIFLIFSTHQNQLFTVIFLTISNLIRISKMEISRDFWSLIILWFGRIEI